MAINAVSTKSTTQLLQEDNAKSVQRKAQAGEAEQVKQAAVVRAAEKTQKPTPAAQTAEANNQPPANNGFVNTKGETTGTRINTTA